MLYGQLDHTPRTISHIQHDLPTLSGLKYTFLSYYVYPRLLLSVEDNFLNALTASSEP